MPSIKIGEFLEPWQRPDVHELRHTVASSASASSIDRRYKTIGQVEPWEEFHPSKIASRIQATLGKQFTPQWQPWLPRFARVIYNERQLESLYYSTLVTRVNLALQNAIPPGHPEVTVIVCPGSFESHSEESVATTILPDWVVVEGTYEDVDDPPGLEDLVFEGKIVAVGDTKLVRHPVRSDATEDKAAIDGTYSCHPSYLAQVQHYAHMLNTRFGFILTNDELVLAQFLRETEASPRALSQRGLRSTTLPHRLHSGLPHNFKSSDHVASEDDKDDGEPLHTPPPRHKRRHESSESPRLPRPHPPPTGYSEMPPSPLDRVSARTHNMPPKSSSPALGERGSMESQPPGPSHLPQSSPDWLSSSVQDKSSSSIPFEPLPHDFEIGRALIRSIRIPNEESGEEDDEEMRAIHPAKALFALLMYSYSLGPQGRVIDADEPRS